MITKQVAVRVIVFVLVWLNQYLVGKGMQPLPVLGEEQIASILTFVISVWTLFADNKIEKKEK